MSVYVSYLWMHFTFHFIHYSHYYSLYRKFPKYSDTRNICDNHPKVWTSWLHCRVMCPKDADGMANSEDPDQTAGLGAVRGAVWSGSTLFV